MNSAELSSSEPTGQLSLNAQVGGSAHGQRGMAEPLDRWGRIGSLGANSLLVALLSPFLALTARSMQKSLLAIIILDIPFQVGTHFYYRESDAALGALGGLSISFTTIALAGLYLSWFIRSLTNRNTEERRSVHINRSLLLYLAIAALSMMVAQDVSLSSFEVLLLLEASLLYFYVANNVRTRQEVIFIVSMLLLACLLESLVMIVLSFTGMPSTIWGLPTHIFVDADPTSGGMRIGGTVGSPNQSAAFLSILLAIAASVLVTSLGRAHKFLAMAVLGLGGVALVFTFSRGGWTSCAVSITILSLVAWRRRGLSLRVPLAAIVVLVLLYLPFHNAISTRLLGDDRGSAESRIPLMKLAFRIVEDNPVLGVGANNFTVVMSRYLTPEFRKGFLYAVHNKYLLILSETGIGGLLTYLAFLLGTVRTGWRCWEFDDRLLSPLALGFMSAITGHMVQMGVDVFRGRPIQQLLWLLAGLMTAMYKMCAAAPRSLSNMA